MPDAAPNTDSPTLTAYVVGNDDAWAIEPASPRRRWMDEFADGFPRSVEPHESLPLL